MFNLWFPQLSTVRKLILLKAAGVIGEVWKTITGAIVSFTTAIAAPVRSLVVAIAPVQSGSGDPAPDNVRPITGWTGCNIQHRGKNLFDEANATQYQRYISYTNGNSAEWKTSSDSRSYAIEVIPGQTYTISLNADPQSTIFRVAAIKVPPTTAGTIASTHAFSNSGNPVYEITFTMREGEKWLVIQVGKSFADERKAKIQVEAGSMHTEYEAYSQDSTTYSIAFPDAAGTVYGGTLDVTNGVLTVDRAILKPTTMRSGAYNSGALYWPWFELAGITADADVICDCLTRKNFTNFKTSVSFVVRNDYFAINPNGAGYSSSSAARNAGSQFITDYEPSFVYPLATPQTYQLTPTEISTLLGSNTIWADTGDVTVEYRES